MWIGERLVGIIQVDRRGKLGGGFHGTDLELIAVFAQHLAALIDSSATTERLRHQVAHLRRVRARTNTLAFSDPLTRLPNRRLFLDRLEQAVARTNRGGTGVALLYIDLDRSKEVDDRCGHEHGARVTRAFAHRLRRCVRAPDTVARLGGDEFAVILDAVDTMDGAAVVCRKIHDAFEARIEIPDGSTSASFKIGISLGVARAPRDGITAAELLDHAHSAMHRKTRAMQAARA